MALALRLVCDRFSELWSRVNDLRRALRSEFDLTTLFAFSAPARFGYGVVALVAKDGIGATTSLPVQLVAVAFLNFLGHVLGFGPVVLTTRLEGVHPIT